MNSKETINKKFIERTKYPIWYYKELEPITIDFVIANLLKETFVVDIKGNKHEIIFAPINNDEIGQCIKYDDIKNSNLTSYNTIVKGFREGKWFLISDKDTTEKFKDDYKKRKKEHKEKELIDWYREVLIRVIKKAKNIDKKDKDSNIRFINELSLDELEKMMRLLFKDNKSVKLKEE